MLESLQELEDNDLDALMADLMADINATEQKLVAERDELKVPSPPTPALPPKRGAPTSSITAPTSPEVGSSTASSVSSPASSAASPLPAPPPQSTKPSMVSDFSRFHTETGSGGKSKRCSQTLTDCFSSCGVAERVRGALIENSVDQTSQMNPRSTVQ